MPGTNEHLTCGGERLSAGRAGFAGLGHGPNEEALNAFTSSRFSPLRSETVSG